MLSDNLNICKETSNIAQKSFLIILFVIYVTYNMSIFSNAINTSDFSAQTPKFRFMKHMNDDMTDSTVVRQLRSASGHSGCQELGPSPAPVNNNNSWYWLLQTDAAAAGGCKHHSVLGTTQRRRGSWGRGGAVLQLASAAGDHCSCLDMECTLY